MAIVPPPIISKGRGRSASVSPRSLYSSASQRSSKRGSKNHRRSEHRRQLPPPIDTQPQTDSTIGFTQSQSTTSPSERKNPPGGEFVGGATSSPSSRSQQGQDQRRRRRRQHQHQHQHGGSDPPPSPSPHTGYRPKRTASQHSCVRFSKETTPEPQQQPQQQSQVQSQPQQPQQQPQGLREQDHSPRFLFEEEKWIETDNDDDVEDGAGDIPPRAIPSEAQLALLCLDYLRDLRRSYQHKEDLLNAEGLDADYLALAAWSLSRAFVRPEKLKHGDLKVSTVTQISRKGKRPVETNFYGGGGLGGAVEDEPYGNDAWYRRLDDGVVIDDELGSSDNAVISQPHGHVFALSEKISLPTMGDITDEVLLCHPNERIIPKKLHDDDREEEGEKEPYYEHNDGHFSNAHRFYLLNGLASDTSSDQIEGLMNPDGLSTSSEGRGAPSSNANISSGGPLSFAEIASAGLTSLHARSRINAEREMVSNPRFREFVQAASAGGFFREKQRSDERRTLTPGEKERRSRLLYEQKYRRIVDRFRTKLARKEARSDPGTSAVVVCNDVAERQREWRVKRLKIQRTGQDIQSKQNDAAELRRKRRERRAEKIKSKTRTSDIEQDRRSALSPHSKPQTDDGKRDRKSTLPKTDPLERRKKTSMVLGSNNKSSSSIMPLGGRVPHRPLPPLRQRRLRCSRNGRSRYLGQHPGSRTAMQGHRR